ncbi:MAG TPA: hypothetical protein VN207_10940 [Ktedonobacteraceae bacterium]|nr:hypothetical protein [Ktedonobacteraceae bacterium]
MSNSEAFFFDSREEVQFIYATDDEEPPWIRAMARVYIWREREMKTFRAGSLPE